MSDIILKKNKELSYTAYIIRIIALHLFVYDTEFIHIYGFIFLYYIFINLFLGKIFTLHFIINF